MCSYSSPSLIAELHFYINKYLLGFCYVSGTDLGAAGDTDVKETKTAPQGADTLVRGNGLEMKNRNNREVKYLVIAYHHIPMKLAQCLAPSWCSKNIC